MTTQAHGVSLRLATMPEVDDDAALLARIAEGDEEAARNFVGRHQADVVRFVSRMLGVHDPAIDDVVQLSLTSALKAAGGFAGRARARTWLLGIANNHIKMTLRSRQRRRAAVQRFAAVRRLILLGETPMHSHDARDRIESAAATLDPDRRAVFVLCEVEERPASEAAEILGVPAGTVRRWRAQARAALRPLLVDLWTPKDAP